MNVLMYDAAANERARAYDSLTRLDSEFRRKVRNLAFKRLSSPIRTFVVLMAATLCAVSFFCVPSTQLWKQSENSNV